MSNSASPLDLLSQAQASKEITANALWDASSPSMIFGRRASACSGLTWGYYGGVLIADGVLTTISNGTLTLAANQTNYVEATMAGVVSSNTSGFTPGRIRLYSCTTLASSVSAYTDYRSLAMADHVPGKASISITSADVTLTAAQAMCGYLTTTGVLSGNRNVIVPNDWQGAVFCNNSGPYTTTFKTQSGSGIVVAQGKRAMLLADGTNVVRLSADV